MRTSRLLIGFILIAGAACKTAQVSSYSAAPYKEDLSVLREDFSLATIPSDEDANVDIITEKVLLEGHIKTELDSVNQLIIAQNRKQHYLDGYTVQIYTGNNREAATAAMEKVAEINADLVPQIEYYQPSYKVKVGQYIDRLKAHEVFESLKEEFPLALLIPERIKVDYD